MLENDRIISLAQTVDVFYPSLYTFYTDKAGWVEYATAQISEARRLANGKPVFAFLWPQYHNSNRLLKCQFLPADYWQLQLETVSKLADGVVIWGGWDVCNSKGKALQWNDNAKWWQVTKAFIKKLKNSSNQG
jgi:Hyaluronidase.